MQSMTGEPRVGAGRQAGRGSTGSAPQTCVTGWSQLYWESPPAAELNPHPREAVSEEVFLPGCLRLGETRKWLLMLEIS